MESKISRFWIFFFVIVAFCCIVITSQENRGEDACQKNRNCSQCMQGKGCAWCSSLNFEQPRCWNLSSTQNSSCGESDLVNPSKNSRTSKMSKVTEEQKFNPGKAMVQLRVEDKVNITTEYKDKLHRPLDLYFLMDVSCTMYRYKQKVANLSTDLVEKMKILTSDLHLGFGSFVDKPTLPFYQNIANETKCEGIQPVKPFIFKNHLSLRDNDTVEFQKVVKGAEISRNVDNPEGQLEALMQVIKCTSEIGWREGSNVRRVVVLSTNGPFHIAGDGKLAGILTRNDAQCHLKYNTTTGGHEYTHALKLDYPSVRQVKAAMLEKQIFVILAVSKYEFKGYQTLSRVLGDLAMTAMFNDSNSITNIVIDEYRKLVGTVRITVEPKLPDYIGMKFFVQCPGQTEFVRSDSCSNLQHGANMTFKIELELKSCPLDRKNETFQIHPVGHNSDPLEITVHMLCSCPCEHEVTKASSECGGNGGKQCGICKCDNGWTGDNCTCGLTSGHIHETCLDKAGVPCAGNGHCFCGECRCDKGFRGTWCQCQEKNCPEDRGQCADDGQCDCIGYSGPTCDCSESKDNCRNSTDELECKGENGSCVCNKCDCNSGYSGKYCEYQEPAKNATVCEGKANAIRPGVSLCLSCLNETDDSPKRLQNCSIECSKLNLIHVDTIGDGEPCQSSTKDSNNCTVYYAIGRQFTSTGETDVFLRRPKNCPVREPVGANVVQVKPDVLPIIISVVSGIVVIGIIFLVTAKTTVHYMDKREYERFKLQLDSQQWEDTNPLYHQVTTEFRNPVYDVLEEPN